MKKRYLVTFVLFFIGTQINSFAQECKDRNKIVTTGEAKIWVAPDKARIFLGIEVLNKTVDSAYEESKTKIEKILKALKDLNIKNLLIKIPNYNVSLVREPTYEATRAGRLPKLLGYKVTQEFTVLLENNDMLALSKDVSRVINTALKNGVNIIRKVQYFKEDDSKEKQKVLKLAVKNAISNAKVIAKAAGVSIKGYSLVDSYISYWSPFEYSQTVMHQVAMPREVIGASTTLVAGKIKISCKVRLECLIE